MKVKELIKELKKLPQDSDVSVWGYNDAKGGGELSFEGVSESLVINEPQPHYSPYKCSKCGSTDPFILKDKCRYELGENHDRT